MSEGHSGYFEKPSSGELQARAAEKIIEGVQRKARQPNIRVERQGTASPPLPALPEQSDKARLDDIRQRVFGEAIAQEHRKQEEAYNKNPSTYMDGFFESYKKWRQSLSRKHAEPQTEKHTYPRVITPHGVATNPEELDRLFELKRIESEENFERQRREAIAKMNATKRLPLKDRLFLLITGSVLDPEKAEELLQEERMKVGLIGGRNSEGGTATGGIQAAEQNGKS